MLYFFKFNTHSGWSIRLWRYQKKGCILVQGNCNKILLFLCQHILVVGHPVSLWIFWIMFIKFKLKLKTSTIITLISILHRRSIVQPSLAFLPLIQRPLARPSPVSASSLPMAFPWSADSPTASRAAIRRPSPRWFSPSKDSTMFQERGTQ